MTFDLPLLSYENKKSELISALQKGADVNEQNEGGYTALFCACSFEYTNIISLLLQHKYINVNLHNGSDGPLHTACANGKLESVRLLLRDPRVNINLLRRDGWTPLMVAVHEGYYNVVRLLLAFGRKLDLDKRTVKEFYGNYENLVIKKDSNVLDIAQVTGPEAMISLLKEYLDNPLQTQFKIRAELNLQGSK